jgi:hypothetical protein
VVFVGGGRAFTERLSEVAMPVVVVWVKGRRSSGSARSGETSADEIEQTRPAGEGGDRFKTTLLWDGELELAPKGMIGRFPQEKDGGGRLLPLLLAAFDKCYVMSVFVPREVAAVGAEAAATLLLGVKTNEADDETLRDNAIHNYTRPEIHQETNRLMRMGSDCNEPEAPLWSFVAIVQMAFVEAMKDSTGGTHHRGGLISKTELDAVRKALAAGHEGEIVLRGVTSCSRSEEVAMDLARSATPSATMAMARQPGLPYGPMSIELISKFPEEKEVILLDGTVLKVSSGDLKGAASREVPVTSQNAVKRRRALTTRPVLRVPADQGES